jgi:hypothetical protein
MHRFGEWSWVKNFRNDHTRSTPIGPRTQVLGRFGPLRYCTNFGAKWFKLGKFMHKFVKWSLIVIFHNKRTQSILLDAKLMFWGISDCFVTAGTRCKWVELVTNALVSGTKSHQNFLQRTDPIHPIGFQTKVLGHFGPFRYYTNFSAKWVEWNFSQRTHPMHPIGPQTHVFGRFGLFCYCMNFGAKWAELVINAQVRRTKSHWNFS